MPRSLRGHRVPARRLESGMTTAEYAVGTIGAAAIGLVLVRVVGDGTFLELVRPFFSTGLLDPPWLDGWPGLRPFRGLR